MFFSWKNFPAMAVCCCASLKISKAPNCLFSDFQRCWAHIALFNFNYESVHSAVLRTKCLEPMRRCLDGEVSPQGHLCIPMQSLGGWGLIQGSIPWMWGSGCSPSPCESALPSPVYPCNEYASVALMDLKVNLELQHAHIGRSCF